MRVTMQISTTVSVGKHFIWEFENVPISGTPKFFENLGTPAAGLRAASRWV